MRKLSKILVYLAFAFGVAMSWATTADQTTTVRNRLTQSLETTSKSPTSKTKKKRYEVKEVPLASDINFPDSLNGKGDGSGSGAGSGDGAGSGNGLGDGDGNGNSAGGNGAADSNRLVMDENAPSQDPNKESGGKTNGGPAPARSVSSSSAGSSDVKGTSTPMKLWWPVCAFVDENVPDSTANAALKGMVEKAATKCGVKIEVYPVKVAHSSWGAWALEPDKINDYSRQKCNVPGNLSGSATALVDPSWKYTAAKMCDDFKPGPKNTGPHEHEGQRGEWNAGVAGCAELAKSGGDLSKDFKDHEKNKAGGHKHSSAKAQGQIAASIEVQSGQSAEVVSHEAIGHSMMGKPNGTRYGLGIGEEADLMPKDKNHPDWRGEQEIEPSQDPTWSEEGCTVMRGQAHKISDWTSAMGGSPPTYDKNQQVYYDPGTELYDIVNGPKLFEKRNTVPPPGPMLAQVPPAQGTGGLPVAKRPQPKSKLDPQFFASKTGKPKPQEAEPQKHKKGAELKSADIASIRARSKINGTSQPTPEPKADVAVAMTPPAAGKINPRGNKVVMMEGAAAVDPSAFAGKSKSNYDGTPPEVFANTGGTISNGSTGNGSSSIKYDENAKGYSGEELSQNYANSGQSNGSSMGSGSGSTSTSLAGSGGTGSTGSGSKMKSGNFSDDTFKNLGDSELTEEELAEKKRRKVKQVDAYATARESGRRPTSESRRSTKPVYEDTGL